MNKYLKATLIFLAFVILGLLLHYGVFEKILVGTPFVKNLYNNSVLTVNTRRGVATIFLNGMDYGQTPQSISNLSEGEYVVELEKVTENTSYPKQSFFIELHRNTEAIVDIEIAPDGFKSGHILYYVPTPGTTRREGFLTIRTDLPEYQVWIDNEQIPAEELFSYKVAPKEYNVKVESLGHEPLEFPIIAREGYNLNIKVYLLPIPFDL